MVVREDPAVSGEDHAGAGSDARAGLRLDEHDACGLRCSDGVAGRRAPALLPGVAGRIGLRIGLRLGRHCGGRQCALDRAGRKAEPAGGEHEGDDAGDEGDRPAPLRCDRGRLLAVVLAGGVVARVLVADMGSLAGLARLTRRLLVLPVRLPGLLAIRLLTIGLLTIGLLAVGLLAVRLTVGLLPALTVGLLPRLAVGLLPVGLLPVGVGVRLAGLATVGPTGRELCGGLCRAGGRRVYRSGVRRGPAAGCSLGPRNRREGRGRLGTIPTDRQDACGFVRIRAPRTTRGLGGIVWLSHF